MDIYMQRLYTEHGITEATDTEEVQSVAKKLLGDPHTMLSGAELILGRRIDSKESTICRLFMFAASPDAAIGALLLWKATESEG